MTAGAGASSGAPSPTALLERESQLDVLRTMVARAAAGQAGVVVVEGAGGIGKTRLLAEARRLAAQDGLRVLRARGGELEREFAFGIVRQLFEPALAGAGEPPFSGAASAARGVFEPAGVSTGEDMSFASLHGLYWLTVNLAGNGPLAICIDDLQWSDVASLRFLAYLVHRLEDLPVLVAGAVRPLHGTGSAALHELTVDPSTVTIRPPPLSIGATAQLVSQRLGAPPHEAFSVACHTATAGNPLLLDELLKTLAVEGVTGDAADVGEIAHLGAAASRAVLARLARLSPGAVDLARATAVLGDDAELSTVAALAGVEIERSAAGVTELIRAEVFDGDTTPRFVHPLVAAAVYQDTSGADRALAHERAAGLLSDSAAGAERVAAHLLFAPARGDQQTVDTLAAAARAALRKGAPESAVAYLQRALREPPPPSQRVQLLLELGRAETLTSGVAAAEHLGQAYELLSDPGSRAAVASSLSRVLLLTGQPAAAAQLARDAAAELPAELCDQRQQLEAVELLALLLAGDGVEASRRLRRDRCRPVGPGLGAKMLAAVAAQERLYAGCSAGQCAELALEALADGELIAADNGLLAVGPIAVLALADRGEAIDASDRSLAEAHRRGSLLELKSVGVWRGFALYWRGELADAEQSLRSAYDVSGLWGIGGGLRLYGDAVLSAVLRERGDLAGARRALEQSSDPGDDGEPARYWVHGQLELLVAEGRMSDAAALAERFQTRFALVADAVDTPWRSPAALALHGLGRERDALALADRDLAGARAWGAPGTVARALRTAGALRGEDGLELLREAVELSAETPARLQYAKTLVALGAALRRARRPQDARKPLRRALALAEALGADRLAALARTELYASGARPRATALRGVAALTPSERRVAGLAASGATNREIAQRLFVTAKTVEMHLSRTYQKLDISSRRGLAAHAAELRGDGESDQPASLGPAEPES